MSTTWHDKWAPEHPVEWESADGIETYYISISDAVARIARDGFDPVVIQRTLGGGGQMRTTFALYRVVDRGLQPVASA